MIDRLKPLTHAELAEIERQHRSPAARRLLTEVWRLRLIELRAEHLMRALANERSEFGGMTESFAVGLREALGLPVVAAAVRSAPMHDDKGLWQGSRVSTDAHRGRERELGRSLNPIEWGAVSDRN